MSTGSLEGSHEANRCWILYQSHRRRLRKPSISCVFRHQSRKLYSCRDPLQSRSRIRHRQSRLRYPLTVLQISVPRARCLVSYQQTKVVVFAHVSSQVERIQSVTVAVVFATNKQTFVSALSSSSGKQAVVCSYILLHLVRLNGSRRAAVVRQVQRYLVQTEMLEVERITRQVSVKSSVAHQSNNCAWEVVQKTVCRDSRPSNSKFFDLFGNSEEP